MKSKTIFVLPDVQAKPDIDFSYLRCIGKYIVKKKPDVIVCGGDFADMESLSSYDVGKKSFEGRSYQKDIWAAREAMDALLEPMFEFNERARRFKEKQYRPEMHMLLGNHENRIDRAVNDDRKLEGLISTDDLPYQDWIVHPFLDVLVLDGIAFSHYFTSGVMGRPIGSMTPAKANVTKSFVSCVFGHSHMRDYWETTDAIGRSLFGLEAGCFFGHEEHYTTESDRWWRGLVVLNDVDEFGQNPSFYGYESILSKFL